MAKGWRFDLDVERIEQSDTWALATLGPVDVRPWLLMTWMAAWKQQPCGSLPNEDRFIAAHIGMPLDMFIERREYLLRGWWTAADGRLYHDTIVRRVQEMLERKEKDRARKATYRAGQKGKHQASDVPWDSQGTDAGQAGDRRGSPTGRTPPAPAPAPAPEPESACGTSAALSPGVVTKAMRAEGIQKASPSNAKLVELVNAGVPLDVFVEAARSAVKQADTNPFGWALSRVKNRLESGDVDLHAGKPKPCPQWASDAGFTNEYEASNAGCREHNAHEFRDGQRMVEVAA